MKRTLPIVLLAALALAACGGEDGAVGTPAAARPAAEERGAVVELRRWQNPQEVVRVGRWGVAMGPAGEPLRRTLFTRPERLEDVLHFARTYAAFRTRTREGELAFRGRGTAKAGPVERRMIAEWARLVAAEAVAGRDGGAAYGLVLAWHQGGPAGSCDDVTLFLTGEARAGSCAWEAEIRGRLAPEQLARLYAWFDRLAPFQSGGEEMVPVGSEQSRLTFAGQGTQQPTREEVAELETLALALQRELAARRPASAASADGAAGADTAATAGEPSAPGAPASRLLLPARPAAPTGSRQPVAVQIPEEPPAPEATPASPPIPGPADSRPPRPPRPRPSQPADPGPPAVPAAPPDILPPP